MCVCAPSVPNNRRRPKDFFKRFPTKNFVLSAKFSDDLLVIEIVNCNCNCKYDKLYSTVGGKPLLGCFTRTFTVSAISNTRDCNKNKYIATMASAARRSTRIGGRGAHKLSAAATRRGRRTALWCVCVCVCVRVFARARVCVCAYACVCVKRVMWSIYAVCRTESASECLVSQF